MFSNTRNAYLNDAANRPRDVVSALKDASYAVQVMQPGDVLDAKADPAASDQAIAFWTKAYRHGA